ncbi:MAG: BamA/TamA family outer membrane protein [Chitinivibrionales bacterium]|nr:BamA/TamA family outer membrane protein [Chitinivibrionales bacterium]
MSQFKCKLNAQRAFCMKSSLNNVMTFIQALFLALVAVSPIIAFGKNKVQYEDLSWEYISTRHFDIYFHQNEKNIAHLTAGWIEQYYRELQRDLKFKHRKKIPFIIYGSPNLFQQTNIITEVIPEGVGGFTELFKNRVVVPFTGSYEEYRHVAHHELVHAFQFGILYDHFGGALLRNTAMQIPLWFAEGSAEFLSSGWNAEADMFLMDRTVYNYVPLPGFELSGYMAYKGGQSFLHFLADTRGEKKFERLLRNFKKTRSIEAALKSTYGKPLEDLGKEWVQELKRIYWPEIGRRDKPDLISTAITDRAEDRSNFNLKPRISPDGEKIAFFTDRKDYTRIVITDRKGSKINEIKQYGYGGYFESFKPFRSGLAWSPQSDQIAFITKRQGKDEIRIVNIGTRELVATIAPDMQAILSPDWSPGDDKIAFIGVKDTATDIFMWDISAGTIEQLTKGMPFESSPRFSPDGSFLLYAAIDSSGKFSWRDITARRPSNDLYLLDVNSRSITPFLQTPQHEKQPSFSPDGNHVAFISDVNGIDNIYIAPFAHPDSARPLTDMIGGSSDPDWSKGDGSLVFCHFQKQGWDIRLIEEPLKQLKDNALTLTNWAVFLRDSTAYFFNPELARKDTAAGKDTLVSDGGKNTKRNTASATTLSDTTAVADTTAIELIGEADEPLNTTEQVADLGASDSAKSEEDAADSAAFTSYDELASAPYRLKFSPDLISVGLGISSLYYSGQGAIVLSDIMGDHRILLAGDVQGRIDQFAHVYGSYIYLKNRIDVGLGAFFNRDIVSTSLFFGDSLYRDTDYGGLLMLSYPFNMFSRIDLNLYGSRIERKPVELTGSYDFKNDTSRTAEDKNLVIPSFSLVFDNILWGITGPVNGLRSEANLYFSPPLDIIDASFISVDFDIRKYFHFAKKFVWANKVSAGATLALRDETPARKFFLGGSENWLFFLDPKDIDYDNYQRNLDYAFYSEIVVPFRGWKRFEKIGTRYAVFNTEFRFPFIRKISVAWPLPFEIRYINGVAFADIGNAWNAEDEYEYVPLPQDIYGGVGFGLRANLGIFILRFDRAWQTDWKRYVGKPRNYFSLGADF